MSTILTKKEKTQQQQQQTPTCLGSDRRSTSMFIDRMLWFRVRKAALDTGTTATDFVENALSEKLDRVEVETEMQGQGDQ